MDSKSTFHYVKKLIKVYKKRPKNNCNQTMPNPNNYTRRNDDLS